ncbi:hypothetical protein DNTS_008662 [Danionella cerebrum]|uniref:Carbonic anhydrase n=1 Tax=Danionella cerebrum TaxID=2873325 RepID=A0A553MKG4_9TELE|nr:hypothetical protein DNTS_008662 [Danionella translucida]
MLLETLILFLVLLFASSASEANDKEQSKGSSHQHYWGYHDQEAWQAAYTDCGGKSQSPVNIDTGKIFYEPSLPAIRLEGYDLTGTQTLTLINNGHTLQLSLPRSMRIIRGFDEVFVAAQLHFHWGSTEVPGSEHTIDHTHYPAEIHVVHYNSKYANLSDAASKADGLAVLAGFIGIGLHENEEYEKILSALTEISTGESFTEIAGFNVRHLLPSSLERFYRYNGSLTTPPCFQTVSWTLFNHSITVSRRQLAALEETLKIEHNKRLSKNFRAPQLLHGRKILSSFHGVLTTEKPRGAPPPQIHDQKIMESNGNILAITFGVLLAVTLLLFSIFVYRQRQKFSKSKQDLMQDVVYTPAPTGNDTDQTTVLVS